MKQVLWFSIVIATGVYICGAVVDPDLWWHITVGRWIISHRAVPALDYWNMFGEGQLWRAYSWTNEILFALVDGRYGVRGLLVLKLLLSVLLSASMFYCFGRIANDWFFGGLLGMFATAACFNHFTLRPQSLTWVYFVWLIFFADEIAEKGFSGRRAGAIFLLMVLWANTHLTSIFGIVGVGVWLLRPGINTVAVKIAAAAFLGTLVTPYLGGEWVTFAGKTTHPFAHRAIAEFQAATVMQYSTSFMLIILFLLGLFFHMRPKIIEPAKYALCAVFVIAGLAVVKFLPFAVIAMACAVAKIWQRHEHGRDALGNIVEALLRFKKLYQAFPKEGLSFVFICTAIVHIYQLWRAPLNQEITPVAAVDFILEKNLPHPLLNDFGRGGYVMYRFSDAKGNLEHKVSIDGRTNVGTPELWDNFMAAFNGKENWRDYIEMVKPSTILWPGDSALVSILLESRAWCLVFSSPEEQGGYSVFLRRDLFESRSDDFPGAQCEPSVGSH